MSIEKGNIHRACWIWQQAAETPNSYVEFRRTFLLPEIDNAYIHVTACQEYLLYLNGTYIGRGPSPCAPEYQYYDSYDVSKALVEGPNTIAAVCYHFGDKDIVTHQMQGKAGFLLSFACNETLILTDEHWCCRTSPRWEQRTARISRWNGYNEIYLAVNEDGWEQVGYDDRQWDQATIRAPACDPNSPWPRLIAREIPALRVGTACLEAIVRVEPNYGVVEGEGTVLAGKRGCLRVNASQPSSLPGVVYDFGKEVVGRPLILIEAPAGGVVRIAYGESLELQYVDTFILKHGLNQLTPFGRRACRYIQLSFMATPEPIEVLNLRFATQHYAFEESGSFESSDALLNQIWDISRYTTLVNSQDHLEDCPWREKALWVADAVVMGKVIYHVFGDGKLLRKCLLQGARIQNEDGSIPGVGPERNPMLLPDFCAHWLLGVRDYWRYSGDQPFLEEIWECLVRLLGWFEAQVDETGLFAGADRPGWWCFIDWTSHIDKRDKVTAIACLHYASLQAMAELASALGRPEAQKFTDGAEALAHAIRANLWLPEQNAYADCMNGLDVSHHLSLQTNFMAIWCGLMSDDQGHRFIQEYYDSNKLVEIKGAFFQHIVLEVFHRLKLHSHALSLIRNYWGEMVARGATTWWETFDPSSSFCITPSTYQGNVPTYLWEGPLVSMCHGWGGSPGYMLHQIVAGINVLQLGSNSLYLTKPAEDGPATLRAVIPTQHGQVVVDWRREEGDFIGTVQVPKDLQCITSPDYPVKLKIIRE